jgi:hypothetical protein
MYVEPQDRVFTTSAFQTSDLRLQFILGRRSPSLLLLAGHRVLVLLLLLLRRRLVLCKALRRMSQLLRRWRQRTLALGCEALALQAILLTGYSIIGSHVTWKGFNS